MPRSRNSRSTATRARPTATGVPCKTTVVRSDWHSTRAPVSVSTRFAVAPFAPTTNPLFPAVSTNHTDSRGSRSCDAGCESRASWSSVRASREGGRSHAAVGSATRRRDRATRRGPSTPRSRRGQVLAPGLGDEVASGRRRRTSAVPSGGGGERPRGSPAGGGGERPRGSPARSLGSLPLERERRLASILAAVRLFHRLGRGHVVQAPRASVIAAKRPVERIANSLDAGTNEGGSRARLVPHHARVHVRVPLVSRRGRVGHDAELMGSLGNATGAIEVRNTGCTRPAPGPSDAGGIAPPASSATGYCPPPTPTRTMARARIGASRACFGSPGTLEACAAAAAGARDWGARRAQLLHLRERKMVAASSSAADANDVAGCAYRGDRLRASVAKRVVRAAGMRCARPRGRAVRPWLGSGGLAENRSLDEAGGARPRRRSVCDRPERAEARRGALGCVRGRLGRGAPPAATTAPAVAIATTACAASAVARVAGALATLVVRGRSTARRDRPRSRSRLRLRLVRRARSGRRSASSSSSSTTSTVVPLRASGGRRRPRRRRRRARGVVEASRRGEPSLRRSSGTPASTSLSASAGARATAACRVAGSPPPA